MAGRLDFTLGLNNSRFIRGMGMAKGAVVGLLGIAGIGGLGYALQRAAREGVNFNAVIEKQQVAFETLLGSAGAARQRIDQLIEFSARTPFQLDEVTQLSQMLQAMTGGALASGAGLRLVGDTAAALGRSLKETGMWIGRLYAGLESGTAVGEATLRLLEMGMVSGQTKRQLDDLAQSGGAIGQVMEVLNNTFGKNADAMDRQSKTFLGLWSTLKDNVLQGLGAAMEPIFGSLKGVLEQLVAYDWKALGRQIGDGLSVVINMFKEGRFWDVLYEGFAALFNFASDLAYSWVLRLEGNLVSRLIPAIGRILSLLPKGLQPKRMPTPAGLSGAVNGLADQALVDAFANFENSPFKALLDSLVSSGVSLGGGVAGAGGAGVGAGGLGGALGGGATMLEKLGFVTNSGGGMFSAQERTARGVDRLVQIQERMNERLEQYLGARSEFINA